jgi:Na+/proline symporter
MLLGLRWADWATLLIYVALTVWAGVAATRKVKDTIDFFMGGRRFGKAFLIFFAFGAGTSGNDAVGVSSKTYTTGLSGIWYQWLWPIPSSACSSSP